MLISKCNFFLCITQKSLSVQSGLRGVMFRQAAVAPATDSHTAVKKGNILKTVFIQGMSSNISPDFPHSGKSLFKSKA